MEITPSTMAAFTRGCKTIFNKAMESEDNEDWKKIVTVIPSTGKKESYPWLGATPLMSEWLSERKIQGVNSFDYEINNDHPEVTMGVDRDALEDDETGSIKVRVQQLSGAAKIYQATKVFEAIVNGTSNLCYDGQAFFSDSHKEADSGVQNNTTAYELTSANLSLAKAKMRRFKNDKGKYCKYPGDTLLVPPELEATAVELTNATDVMRYTAEGVTKAPTYNVHRGKWTVIVVDEIEDVDSWYLLSTKGPIKPIIYQDRKKATFEDLLAGTENAFMRNQFLYGVDMRFGVGYADWRRAIANIPA